jgi:hypothetical protein
MKGVLSYKSPNTFTELNERCNTKTGTHLFVGAQAPVKVCKGQRDKDRDRETTLETKINNNIRTNYIQYTVGNPFI